MNVYFLGIEYLSKALKQFHDFLKIYDIQNYTDKKLKINSLN